jgi:hypothetical protein
MDVRRETTTPKLSALFMRESLLTVSSNARLGVKRTKLNTIVGPRCPQCQASAMISALFQHAGERMTE